MITIHQALEHFNHIMPICKAEHLPAMRNLMNNIIKQYSLELTSMAVHCMNQSLELHEQYLKAKQPIIRLSADEQVQYWHFNQLQQQEAEWHHNQVN
jgi:hypothetical protein